MSSDATTARRTPRVIPVIDVMGGVVVRAVGGRRDAYSEWSSPLAGSSDPEAVARALLARTGAETLYVADLDMLRWGVSDWDRRFLSDLPAITLLDAGGLVTGPGLRRVREVVASEIETNTPTFVREMLRRHRSTLPPAFSVDVRNGRLLGRWNAWGVRGPTDVLGLAGRAGDLGFRTLIVLDVASVGTGRGPNSAAICESIRKTFPHVELITGGGVRSWADIDRLGECGVDGVLVASALHDGTLTFPRPTS